MSLKQCPGRNLPCVVFETEIFGDILRLPAESCYPSDAELCKCFYKKECEPCPHVHQTFVNEANSLYNYAHLIRKDFYLIYSILIIFDCLLMEVVLQLDSYPKSKENTSTILEAQ